MSGLWVNRGERWKLSNQLQLAGGYSGHLSLWPPPLSPRLHTAHSLPLPYSPVDGLTWAVTWGSGLCRCPGGQGSGTTVLWSEDSVTMLWKYCSTCQCSLFGELFSLEEFWLFSEFFHQLSSGISLCLWKEYVCWFWTLVTEIGIGSICHWFCVHMEKEKEEEKATCTQLPTLPVVKVTYMPQKKCRFGREKLCHL